MIRSLRKTHLTIWIMLAFLLPIGFVGAYMVIPQATPFVDHSNLVSGEAQFTLKRIDRANGDAQLEITIIRPLTTPSTLVYLASQSSTDIKTATLIGSLGPRGKYKLNLPSPLPVEPVVLFYDAINKNIYHQIAFP